MANILQVILVSKKILMPFKSSLLVGDEVTVTGSGPPLEGWLATLIHRAWFSGSTGVVIWAFTLTLCSHLGSKKLSCVSETLPVCSDWEGRCWGRESIECFWAMGSFWPQTWTILLEGVILSPVSWLCLCQDKRLMIWQLWDWDARSPQSATRSHNHFQVFPEELAHGMSLIWFGYGVLMFVLPKWPLSTPWSRTGSQTGSFILLTGFCYVPGSVVRILLTHVPIFNAYR